MDRPVLKFYDAAYGGFIHRDPNEKLTRYDILMELLDGWQRAKDNMEMLAKRRGLPGMKETVEKFDAAIEVLTKSYGLDELTKHSEDINAPYVSIGSQDCAASELRDLSIPDATGDSRCER